MSILLLFVGGLVGDAFILINSGEALNLVNIKTGLADWGAEVTEVLCDGLKKKFPVLKVIGNLIYNRYINPIIVAPDMIEFQVL